MSEWRVGVKEIFIDDKNSKGMPCRMYPRDLIKYCRYLQLLTWQEDPESEELLCLEKWVETLTPETLEFFWNTLESQGVDH
jgi:hypothetical protein